jgi:ankyrin repeat protein
MLRLLKRRLLAAAVALLGIQAAVAWTNPNSTPLIEAAKEKQTHVALKLIAEGADVKAREVDGTTALHYAAHNGDVELVAKLLRAGADPAVSNDYGATPLGEAAVFGNTEIIRLLLRAGAPADQPNPEGQTPLMVVARTGNVEAAKLLLKKGANVNAVEQWGGQTALMWASAQGHPDMVRLLMKHGANVNARAIVRDWQRRVTAEGRPKDMNRGGLTPLLYAARDGCIGCAKALVEGGADINLPDPDGTTPLVLALMNMHFDLAAYLIEAGADVNKWDFWGQTPLYVAIDMNTLPTGGRPDIPSTDKLTGYDIAAMLLEKGANPNIQLKLRPPYRNAVFDRGGDQVLSTGATPLLLAAKVGDAESVKLLLRYHAKVNLPTSTGVTPLMAAAGMGHSFNPTRGRFKTDEQGAQVLKLLIEAGGEVNAQAGNGMTAMHAAASHGWNSTIRALVENGAELEPVDSKGLRPIDFAVGRHERAFLEPEHKRHEETIQLLTELIVKATGRAPKEFQGSLAQQTRGTGAAPL